MIIQGMSAPFAPHTAVPTLPSLKTPLNHPGVILATGADAASFLQGQLTQDVQLMPVGESRLAGYCSAKGRLLASFWVHKRSGADGAPEFLLVCSRDILAATLKRLSMFVMRAKVKLSDASGQFQLFGLTGDAIEYVANNGHFPRLGGQNPLRTLLNLPPVAGVPRALCLVDSNAAATAAPADLANPAAIDIENAWWRWSEVASGIALITQPVVEAFVPQMLNYESVGGVNFKKGCYPGQEVVARSQFRGTLKRRAYLVHSDAPLQAGDEVFGPQDAEQACGTVVQAAAAPDFTLGSGFDAIVSMQVAAAQAGGLTLKSANGAKLTLMALPYVLLEDI
jgi:tRNA-modifying protein YgfZ